LVAAPGVGYLIAYVHEIGWATQFGIPPGLITTQLTDVLAATAFLFVIAALLPLCVLLYRSVRPSVPIGLAEWLVVCVIAPLAVFLWFISVGDPEQGAASVIATILLILVLIAAIVFRSGIIRRRLKEDAWASRDVPFMRALTDGGRTFWVVLCIAVVVGVLPFAYALGGEQARNQLTFLVSDKDPKAPEVELAIYGDTVVLAPFDQSTRRVRAEFDIVKIGPTPLHLRYEKVGPLKTDKKLTLGP
jgi:signal transduction histidine kinase